MSYLKHNTKKEKRERESEKKGGKRGGKKEAQCVHISLAWRFAEVCTPLEPAVSIANDTSGASLGNGVRCAPGFHISSTRYFGIRKRGLWGTSFQELIWLFLSLSVSLASSPLQSVSLLSSFLLLLYFCICRHSLSHSSSPSLFLPPSLPLSLLLFDLVRMISSMEEKNACTGEGKKIFLLTYSLYVKSRGFFLSPLVYFSPFLLVKANECLKR